MDPRLFTATLALVVFVLATICTFMYRWVIRHPHDAHDTAARLLLFSLWVLAGLGLYSGTSFLWAADIQEWVLDALRYVRLALTVAVGIMLLGVMAYWIRILRR